MAERPGTHRRREFADPCTPARFAGHPRYETDVATDLLDPLGSIDEAVLERVFALGAAAVPAALPTPVLRAWQRELSSLSADGAHARLDGVRFQGLYLTGSIREALPVTHAVLCASQRRVLDLAVALDEPSLSRQLFSQVLLQRYQPGSGLLPHIDGIHDHPPYELPDDDEHVAANRAYFGLSFVWTVDGTGQFSVHDRTCWDRVVESTLVEPGTVTITLNAPIDPASEPAVFAQRFPVHSVANIRSDAVRTIMSFDMKQPHPDFGFDRIVREWFDETGRTYTPA